MNYYATEDELNQPPDNPVVWVGTGTSILGEPEGYIYGHRGHPVTLFTDEGLMGNSLRFNTPMDSNLPEFAENNVSSISIQTPVDDYDGWAVKVYEGRDLSGGCLLLDDEVLDLSLYRFDNLYFPLN